MMHLIVAKMRQSTAMIGNYGRGNSFNCIEHLALGVKSPRRAKAWCYICVSKKWNMLSDLLGLTPMRVPHSNIYSAPYAFKSYTFRSVLMAIKKNGPDFGRYPPVSPSKILKSTVQKPTRVKRPNVRRGVAEATPKAKRTSGPAAVGKTLASVAPDAVTFRGGVGVLQPAWFNAATGIALSSVLIAPTNQMDAAPVAFCREPMAVHTGMATGFSPRPTFADNLNRMGALTWTPFSGQKTAKNIIKTRKFESNMPFLNAKEQIKLVRGSTVEGNSGALYCVSNTFVWGGGGAIHLGFGPQGERIIAKVITVYTPTEEKVHNKGNLHRVPIENYYAEKWFLKEIGLLRDETTFENKAHLIMDYQPIDGSDLMCNLLYNENRISKDYGALIVYFLLQGASALQSVHEKEWAVFDVKAQNFMATKQGKLIYIDFGIAQRKGENGFFERLASGTPGYQAPEVFFALDPEEAWNGDRKISQAADIWSLAVTVLDQFPDSVIANFFSGITLDGKQGNPKDHYHEFKDWHAEMTYADGTLRLDKFEQLKSAPRPGTPDMLFHKYAIYSGPFFITLVIQMMNPTLPPLRPTGAQIRDYVQTYSFTPVPDIEEAVKYDWLKQINTPHPEKEAVFTAMFQYYQAHLKTSLQTP